MTLRALDHPLRRGACPGLSAPMATGDGLLVRLQPIGTIPLAAFAALCAAARQNGNGVVEVTSRGSIQVRGLSSTSAPRFAAAVAALHIAADDGIPILTNPLAGLDADELTDASALAAELRMALARRALAARVSAKTSVAIDGGGALNLDALPADVRLGAEAMDGKIMLRASVGGDGTTATQLGVVGAANGVEAALRLLEVIARRGGDARARDILAVDGSTPFQGALASHPALCRAFTSSTQRNTKDAAGRDKPDHDGPAIGLHRLRDGSLACGVGLAFGHADATSLEQLIEHARDAGANGVRTAPGRTLLAIGLTPGAASAFAAAAERRGFIVRADDPRRHVVACAGAPICASAYIAARAMAPSIAATAAPHLGAARTIHISGCAKGCAHPGPAALTIVGAPGGCAVIAHGSTRDVPLAVVTADELPNAIAKLAQQEAREGDHV